MIKINGQKKRNKNTKKDLKRETKERDLKKKDGKGETKERDLKKERLKKRD